MGRVIRNQRKGRGSIFSQSVIDPVGTVADILDSGPYPPQQSAG